MHRNLWDFSNVDYGLRLFLNKTIHFFILSQNHFYSQMHETPRYSYTYVKKLSSVFHFPIKDLSENLSNVALAF